MSPHFFWYLARASGVVTFGLLTLSTMLGLLISTRLGDRLFERAWAFELHKFASLLGLAFLGLHMVVLLPDPWTHFTLIDLFVPATSAYRPAAVAVGVLAMYGSVVATASFFVRRQIGHRAWRLLHYTAFATFFLALLHGFVAGTDSTAPWLQLIYASSGLLVSSLTVYRLRDADMKAARTQRAIKKNAEAISLLESGQSRILSQTRHTGAQPPARALAATGGSARAPSPGFAEPSGMLDCTLQEPQQLPPSCRPTS